MNSIDIEYKDDNQLIALSPIKNEFINKGIRTLLIVIIIQYSVLNNKLF